MALIATKPADMAGLKRDLRESVATDPEVGQDESTSLECTSARDFGRSNACRRARTPCAQGDIMTAGLELLP